MVARRRQLQVPDEGLIVEARGENLLAVKFTAMASPCEVLLPLMSHHAALAIGAVAAQEAWRVEKKYSRYRDDSVTAWIHANRGTTIEVDEETASLIDFASQCFDLSEGLFDITSGVLRRAWTFDGSDRIPEAAVIERLLASGGFREASMAIAAVCCCRREWNWISAASARNMPSIALTSCSQRAIGPHSSSISAAICAPIARHRTVHGR